MKKENNTRDRKITFRTNETEYQRIKERIGNSGLSLQSYLLQLATNGDVIGADIMKDARRQYQILVDIDNNLRDLVQAIQILSDMDYEILDVESVRNQRKELQKTWQSIEYLINRHTQ